MANTQEEDSITLSTESVSAVFAHDISTPLTTAQLNAKLLMEHAELLQEVINSDAASHLPVHIKAALERSPKMISENLTAIQKSLNDYKRYLNSIAVEEPKEHVSLAHPSPEASGTKPSHSSSDRLNILLVDDEDIHHDIADAVLGTHYVLTHEGSGLSAITQCKDHEFDVILMDLQMPVLPGPQTTEKLRRFVPESTLIIGLTNMPIESRRTELMESGFDEFLEKPLKLSDFQKLIDTMTIKRSMKS